MKTRCLGWVGQPSHPEPLILRDDGVDDGLITDGLCYDCLWTFKMLLAERAEQLAKVPS